MGELFSLQDIYTAYRRMKNYFFYDKSNLFIRDSIANFEYNAVMNTYNDGKDVNINEILKPLFEPVLDVLNELLISSDSKNDNISQSLFNKWLSHISYKLVPKDLLTDKKTSDETLESFFITNHIPKGSVVVNNYNIWIEAPIELHIISFLWVEFVGVKLSHGVSDDNYAYQLNYQTNPHDKKRTLKSGLSIVKPYFKGYKQWRDHAMIEAKRIMDNGSDVTMLSLDIQRYFYSLRLNVIDIYKNSLDNDIYSDKSYADKQKVDVLNDLLQRIHEDYHEKVNKLLPVINGESEKKGYTVLPVGLLSSGILGNIYLSDFDKLIKNRVCPHYYGRYVDDMLFVFSNHFVDVDKKDVVEKFIDEYFCSKEVLEKKNEDYIVNDCRIDSAGRGTGRLKIQPCKVVMQHFEHPGSHAAIDLFMADVNKNRSEYRFLPDEDFLTREFDNDAYHLLYKDSSYKFRSITDCKKDKYGVVKFLSSQIFLSGLSDSSEKEIKSNKETATQILSFFQHNTAIEMFSLWERVATYFIVNKDDASLRKFYENVKLTIEKLKYKDGPNVTKKLYVDLLEYLKLSLAMPLALCPKAKLFDLKDMKETKTISKYSFGLRHSNMFRLGYIGVLGINLTDKLFDDDVDLWADNIMADNEKPMEIIRFLYPTYIHFEEINMLYLYHYICQCSGTNENAGINQNGELENGKSCYEQLERDYNKYNREWLSLFNSTHTEVRNHEESCALIRSNGEFFNIRDITSVPIECDVDKRIAIVNTKVVEDDYMSIVKYHNSRCSIKRRNNLCKIINDATKEKSDILVMPELTVPFEWLKLLAGQVKRTGMAIVTGLEYYIDSNGCIYNFVATILPVIDRDVATCVIHLRLKNFYSPKERMALDGYHFQLPSVSPPQYNLFHWRKCYFSVYNCFELADINSRAKYQSKVDFIIAVEYNRDTNYYSDVVGSWARDVHCFIVQVNTSDYGDSKIIMPSKTENKTLVHVKGGENATVLVATLPIKRLRDFQLGGYSIQASDKLFKFTPPCFSHKCARMRYENKDFPADNEE